MNTFVIFFYIEKKQVYKYFREYLLYFDEVDKDLTAYAQKRVKEIKGFYCHLIVMMFLLLGLIVL